MIGTKKGYLRKTLLATSIAAACLSTIARADTTLYVGMNGGTMQNAYTQYVFPDFEKANNVKVQVVPGTSSDILAKAVASRANPQMNLMFLDDGLMYRAVSMNLCVKQSDADSIKALYPQAVIKGGMATGVTMSMTGLGYNTKLFAEKRWAAPTSWNDLADPKFKDEVVFQSMPSSTFGLHAMLMLNRIEGGSDTNVDPFFKAWAAGVGKNNPQFISNTSTLSELVQTEQAAIFPFTPTLTAIYKQKGLPVDYVAPKEGSVVLMVAQCVIANNSQPALTQKLAAYLLSPHAQSLAYEHGAYNPTNTATPIPAAQQADAAKIKGYLKNAVTVDWDAINANRAQWDTRWTHDIER